LEVGETEVEPPATGVTAPTEWSMVIEVACAVVHERLEESPFWMLVGFAVSVHLGGGGGVTVTVAVQWTVPPLPIAVPV
jgi:hypothetical protein